MFVFPDPCVILDSYGDGVYLNISLLGVAAVENDLDLAERSLSGGCDSGYSGISTQYFYYENDDGFIGGVTALHIACIEGSVGTHIKIRRITYFIIIRGHKQAPAAAQPGCECPGPAWPDPRV